MASVLDFPNMLSKENAEYVNWSWNSTFSKYSSEIRISSKNIKLC